MLSIDTVYVADDEEPKCGRCDHINDSDEWCVKNCGAHNGWNGYERTVFIESEE